MVNGESLTLAIAFLAGLATFLAPCILPVIPAYVSYLGGRYARSASVEGNRQQPRGAVLLHALAFIAGFTSIFLLFNIVAAAIGLWLGSVREILARLGGVVVLLLGLHTSGLLRLPWLEYDLRVHATPRPDSGYLTSALMGVIFSAGWSPCVGPTLGMIMTLAMYGQSVLRAVLLGMAFSLGLAIPFLVAALGLGWVTRLLQRYRSLLRGVEIALGILLILVGLTLVTGTFNNLTNLLPPILPFDPLEKAGRIIFDKAFSSYRMVPC